MNDLKISGAGVVSSGTYNNVKIAGSAKVEGDVECVLFQVHGSAKTKGNLYSNKCIIRGAMRVLGNLKADEVDIAGSITVDKDLIANRCKVSGSLKVDGEINVEHLTIKSKQSTLKIVYGNIIEIKGDKRFWNYSHNTATEIEASTIDVSYLKAEKLSGEKIIVGPRSVIGLVEYKDEYTVDKSATVGQVIRLG